MSAIDLEYVKTKVVKKAKGNLPSGLEFSNETSLEDLGLSSLQVAEIVFGIEEDMGIEFDAEKASEAKTLGELIDLANDSIAEGSVN